MEWNGMKRKISSFLHHSFFLFFVVIKKIIIKYNFLFFKTLRLFLAVLTSINNKNK